MVQPTVARLMQATRAQFFRPGLGRQAGFVFRENRVPYYQRLMQRDDGKRQWWKSHRSPYMLYPYYVVLWGTFVGSIYATVRMVFGHKTWFSEG